jgi:Cof subfamily protein (haloacid dehalogenase superfamily)
MWISKSPGDSSIGHLSLGEIRYLKYKIIALDIDGTLKGDSSLISPYMLEILEECSSRGALVSVATGRSLKSALIFLRQAPMIETVVSFQGALVSFDKGQKNVWETFLSPDQVSLSVRLLAQWDVEIVGYAGDDVYVEKMSDWAESYGERNGVKIFLVDSLEKIGRDMYRVLGVGDPEVVAELELSLKSKYSAELYATRSLPHFCEILSVDAGKDKALAWLCSQTDVKVEEVIAFGNGFNDVEMLKWAGTGIAMAGGESVVFEVCDDLAKSPDEDGVAVYLGDLLSKNQIGL